MKLPPIPLPAWTVKLRHLYWCLRSLRGYDTAGRRRFYRYIRAERDALTASGVPPELIRLTCRYLADPGCVFRARALISITLTWATLDLVAASSAAARRFSQNLPAAPKRRRCRVSVREVVNVL